MVSVASLAAQENSRWQKATMEGAKSSSFTLVAKRLVSSQCKSIYQTIEAQTKVPWFVVAVIHEREASQNFSRSLAQGDPWNAVSVHVPKGRGPFKSFIQGAYDALVNCAPKAARWTDWSIGGILTILEEYNGLGYAGKGVPSPYIWAGTNQYTKGKYTSDGHYDPDAVDGQLGCAGLLMAMQQIDSSIVFGQRSVLAPTPNARISPSRPSVPVVPPAHAPPSIVPDSSPSVAHPAAGSLGDAIAKILHALFSHL